MKNNDDIHSADTNEIKHLINRVKKGELDQDDALLIEKLLNILLAIVSLIQRKHTSIQRMKELLFGVLSVNGLDRNLAFPTNLLLATPVRPWVPAHRRLTKELRLARNRLISACAWS